MTGSTETGKIVSTNAAPMLKHVHVELGGKNGIIVLDDADLDFAVQAILWSAYGTSGQRCTAGSRIIVQDGVYDALLEKLAAGARAHEDRPRLGRRRRGRPAGAAVSASRRSSAT